MDRRIPYGIMNYAEIIEKKGYFVDKTRFIDKLERIQNPVFLRPRRFGKSLFCSMLQYYYDLKEADRFDELFGHTWIGKNPTDNHNSYITLNLDFSVIPVSENIHKIEDNFNLYCNSLLSDTKLAYPDIMKDMPEILSDAPASINLVRWLNFLKQTKSPPVYVIIDEYDNFANQLITSYQDHLFATITHQ